MRTRRFGKTDWQVSEIGYGMWGMGSWLDSVDDESRSSLQLALDLGCNFFDTAWAYGEGKSESFLGELIRSNPGTLFYTATKVPPKNFKWPSIREYTLDDCFPPDHIQEYVEKSLKNAGVASFNLVQLHTWEDKWHEDERLLRKVDDLKREGLIQAFGISLNRWEPWNGIEAVSSGLIDAVQVIYNIFDQAPEDALFPACRENDVAVIARVPFDEGTFTGNLTLESRWPEGDWRNRYFREENLRQSLQRVEALMKDLPEGASLPEIALRFILSHPDVSTVIPGMRKAAHVRANCGCSERGPLEAGLLTVLKKHRWDRKPKPWSD
jgi:aryl-alcohol dehydrogenase-like predicted oxidoreductase